MKQEADQVAEWLDKRTSKGPFMTATMSNLSLKHDLLSQLLLPTHTPAHTAAASS